MTDRLPMLARRLAARASLLADALGNVRFGEGPACGAEAWIN